MKSSRDINPRKTVVSKSTIEFYKIYFHLELLRNINNTRSVTGLYIAGRRVSFLRVTLSQSHANYLIEEQIIVQFILDLDSRGFSRRLRYVEKMANRLLVDREKPPIGKRWASSFVKRRRPQNAM